MLLYCSRHGWPDAAYAIEAFSRLSPQATVAVTLIVVFSVVYNFFTPVNQLLEQAHQVQHLSTGKTSLLLLLLLQVHMLLRDLLRCRQLQASSRLQQSKHSRLKHQTQLGWEAHQKLLLVVLVVLKHEEFITLLQTCSQVTCQQPLLQQLMRQPRLQQQEQCRL